MTGSRKWADERRPPFFPCAEFAIAEVSPTHVHDVLRAVPSRPALRHPSQPSLKVKRRLFAIKWP